MKSRVLCVVAYASALIFVLCGTDVQAQLAATDHLSCYKIKDSAKLKPSRDAGPFVVRGLLGASDCKILTAKLLCVPADATAPSSPTPPLGVAGFDVSGPRVCYKVKCSKTVLPEPTITDPFGTRTFGKAKASLVCMPAASSDQASVGGLAHLPLGNATLSVIGAPPDEQLVVTNTLRQNVDGVITDVSGATADQHWSARIQPDGSGLPDGTELSIHLRALINDGGTSVHGDVIQGSIRYANRRTGWGWRLAVHGWGDPDSVEMNGTVTCGGVVQGSASKPPATSYEAWHWLVDTAPDLYEMDLPIGPGPRAIAFGWSGGCTPIVDPNTGESVLGDRLTISMPAGADVLAPVAVMITGEGVQRLAIGEEGVKEGSLSTS